MPEPTGALAPDANASPAAPATTEVVATPPGSEAAPSATAVPSEKSAKPPKSGEQIRIDELTRRLRESERRTERLLRHAEQLGASPQPHQPPQQQQAPARKTLKDFNYDEGAYSEHLLSEAANRAATVGEQKAREAFKAQTAAQRRATYETRAQAFASKVEDFDEVIHGQWACSEPMAEVIEESDEGPALAYYLAQNPEIAAKLAQLSPANAGRELTRIEDKLILERKAAATPKTVTEAPPPTPKIEGADPGNVEADPSKMSQAQFNKWREKHIAARR